MELLELSSPVFSILSGLIEEKLGLHYDVSDRDLLRDKASGRAQEAGFESLLDYYYFLRYDSGAEKELQELAETLIVGETYFFREWPAIQAVVENVIAPRCAAGKRPRIWSAACATGEEPLSLAMILSERGLLSQVDLVASDLSFRELDRAQRGVFGRRALRAVPDPALAQRFIRPEATGYSVAPELIRKIQWRRINLLDRAAIAANGVYDLILCRNVLIYFSDVTVRKVLDGLCGAMAADGALLVGVSESLLRYGSALTVEEKGGTFIYRKAATS